MTTLITGASGFLGRKIVDCILNNTDYQNLLADGLILLGHSEKRADFLQRETGIPVYVGDISNGFFLENIFRKNKIERIIHSAAIKYVSVSNQNPVSAIEANVLGSYFLVKLAIKYDIKFAVGISTDKALLPANVYGMTKNLMEHIFIESGYTIVSGVNFFGSSGSVLDIWKKQIDQKKPLTITDKRCIRYFIDISDMARLVLSSFEKKGMVHPDYTIQIKMEDLLNAFMDYYDYHDYEETGLLDGEKVVEDIDSSIICKPSSNELLLNLIDVWDKNYL